RMVTTSRIAVPVFRVPARSQGPEPRTIEDRLVGPPFSAPADPGGGLSRANVMRGTHYMAETPSIVLYGVDKEIRRDEFRIPVLVNLDLSVLEGEFVALMGPSGSGKTTLLNLIAGLDRATRGKVIVHGQDLGELSDSEITRWRANNVGFIFQTYNLIPVLTA